MTARDALAAIRERAEAATEGPWWGGGNNRRRDAVGLVGRLSDRGTGNAIAVLAGVGMDRVADAEFIAHARTDVPALVGALEAVLDLAESIERARFMRVEMSTAEIHTRLTGALSKLEGQ